MPSTHLSLHYHVVFSTKERRAAIMPEWRDRLHAYLGGIVREMGAIPEAVGGVADHVHMLMMLKATHRLSDVLREVKGRSSVWIHETLSHPAFAWQDGYAAFSVSADRTPNVTRYIQNQMEHHHNRSFQEEYLEFLKAGAVVYNEKYLW